MLTEQQQVRAILWYLATKQHDVISQKCYCHTVSSSQCTDSSRWFTCPCSICGV